MTDLLHSNRGKCYGTKNGGRNNTSGMNAISFAARYEVRIKYVATSKTHEAIVEEFIFVTGKSAV